MPMHTVDTAYPSTALRRSLWIGVLVVASIGFSWAFACAAPFAAFAAAAALTMARRDALTLIVAVWAANQAVGFVPLGYPTDATSLAWGAMLAAAAIAATLVAQLCAARLADVTGLARGGATLVAAYMVYEVVLVAVTPLLGGIESFTPAIVAQVFALNAFGFVGLYALTQVGAFAGVAPHWRLARPAA
jgi:hypothetical protein